MYYRSASGNVNSSAVDIESIGRPILRIDDTRFTNMLPLQLRIGLSSYCIISEIKILVENRNFFNISAFDAPVRRVPVEILLCRLVWEK